MEKILVVEDDLAVQRTLRRLFESEDYAVELAPDGKTGLDAFHSSPPSAVVLDQQPAGQTPGPNNVDMSAIVDAGLQREPHGDLKGAMEKYDEVLAKAPDNLSALQAKGQLLLGLGKLREVIILLRKVAGSDPKNQRANYSLALAFFEAQDPIAALAEVQQTLKLDPSYSRKFRTDSSFAPYIKSSIDFRRALAAAAN